MSDRPTCGSADNLGEVRVGKGTVEADGSCNFCSRPHRVVHILSGNNVRVRLCAKCLITVKNYAIYR